MSTPLVANIRNFVLLGHTGSGKTTLIESILHRTGQTERPGSTANGTSAADWTDEERERKISIWAKPFHVTYQSAGGAAYDLTMIDTPGYADLHGQVVAAAAVADAALIVIDATGGIPVGASRAWQLCESNQLPCGIVITGLDKENADFDRVLGAIQAAWGRKCVPVELPTRDRRAIVDILSGTSIPGDLAAKAQAALNTLEEDAAEEDDGYLNKYLNGEHLSPAELISGLRVAVKRRHLVPVFEVEALQGVGVGDLLDEIGRLFPTPEDHERFDADGRPVAVDPGGPFAGLVWRSVNDPFIGQMQLVRVFSGTLSADSELLNVSRNHKERIGTLHVFNGKKDSVISRALPGQIVSLAKLKATGVNDSLCQAGAQIKWAPIRFPQPVMQVAVAPKTPGDDDKIGAGLHRIVEEDPTFHIDRNTETHELILSGMGDIHIDVAVGRMKRRNNLSVEWKVPKVAYKETITSRAEGHYKHKKQSGGRGQYGEVYLRVEPADPGDDDWFVNEITGGAIPKNFIPAVEKGVLEGLQRGVLAGFPLIRVKARIFDGSYHDVDSSEVAFKIAGARALTDGAAKARPVLLEPVMTLAITVPEKYTGDINGDMNHRRGRILGIEVQAGGMQVITAEVPQAEIFRYAAELRSLSQGQGVFESVFNRYEVVPAHLAKKVIDAAVKRKDEED